MDWRVVKNQECLPEIAADGCENGVLLIFGFFSDYAVGDLKWTSNNLLSLIGIFNTVGEVLVGYLGDKEWIDLNCFYAGKISFVL